LTPIEHYQRDLQREDFVADADQQRAVERLQQLYDALVADSKPISFFSRFFSRLGGRPEQPNTRGLYMWGGVGRGKTYLMDIFFDTLPFVEKKRLHFHRFMRGVHQELNRLKGNADPLKIIADDFSRDTKVLCFDEFFVSDITDAMLLGTLMSELFERGLVLVATSNIHPKDLYKDGLQRSRFLPAIDALIDNVDVLNVDSGVDYRLRTLERIELYHVREQDEDDKDIDDYFVSLVPEPESFKLGGSLEIEGRFIETRKLVEEVVWFEFNQICDGPRSQNDYIEIAREFHSVLISRVPRFVNLDDQARRFISLVDEFYDRGVKLILSADVPLEHIYGKGRLEFEFQRTRSRLLEMQSTEYLKRPHKP
jgi:cell division protein ZapE